MLEWWRLLETEFDSLSYDLQHYLYDEFYQFAYKEIIFLLRDHSLVEDIIQEAFLKATKKRHQLKDSHHGIKWVKRIVRNQMIDTLKSKKYRHWMSVESVYKANDSSSLEVAASINIELTIEDSFRNQVLQKAIMELKSDFKAVLLKFYMEEKTYKEIALELGVSEQAVAQRLVRARKALLRLFTKKWGDENE